MFSHAKRFLLAATVLGVTLSTLVFASSIQSTAIQPTATETECRSDLINVYKMLNNYETIWVLYWRCSQGTYTKAPTYNSVEGKYCIANTVCCNGGGYGLSCLIRWQPGKTTHPADYKLKFFSSSDGIKVTYGSSWQPGDNTSSY